MSAGLVRTTAELEAACAAARADGLVALDTEFVWKRTYRPRLGIVQMGCRQECWALDCMCGMKVEALADLIADGAVVKILHDARQDLMHLRHYTGAAPRNVFDTQLAAAFAGFPAGLGLQKLLFEAIDIGLPKTETLTDWTQRPLSPAQLQYALDDVRYLPALRDELLKRAAAFGTAEWLAEDMLRYEDASAYEDGVPEEMWRRVKLHGIHLDRQGFARLRAVAALREELAQDWNLPRNWLGDDESLGDMAQHGKVGRLRHRLRPAQADVARARYAAALAAAADLPPEEWPEEPVRHYLPEVRTAAAAACEWLREKAAALHVDAAVIASRATVTAFVDNVDDQENPLANGWRHEAVGREMAERFGVA